MDGDTDGGGIWTTDWRRWFVRVHPLLNHPLWLLFMQFHSGQVFRGSWNKIDVAIKVLRSQGDVMPDPKVSTSLNSEILVFLTCGIGDPS